MDGDSQTADMTAEPVEMLVEGTVVTMDPDRRVIPGGAVAVAGDRIAEVGAADDLRARHPDARRLGGSRRYVIPGLIDCHNHIAQALCRESTVEDFPNIYRIYIPAEAILSTDDVRVSARVAFAQLLRAGVTTMTETTCTVAHEEPIAETVMETGIRCALARGMWDRESRLAGNYEQITERSLVPRRPGRAGRRPGLHRGVLRQVVRAGRGPAAALGTQPGRAVVLRRALPGHRRDGPPVGHRDHDPHQPRPRGDRAERVAVRAPAAGAPGLHRRADRAAGGHPRHAHHRPRDRPDGRGRRQAGPRPRWCAPTSCRRSPGCR